MTVQLTGLTPKDHDVDAILALVAAVDHAQRTEDADAFMELFAPNATWVTGHGKRLSGKDTIDAFTRKVLPGATQNGTATYQAVQINFIRHDVAAVNVRQRYSGPEAAQGSPLYVLAKNDNGDWRINQAQNTVILDPETLAEN